ncbi:hypothetical protein K502DRAFT_312641 [Neoconidiobolus thromboides FSU 785]|nr:hypothetical protein K502DRAFT_312641 [Neoconidiobolus thromboides FSU 785]
MSLPLLPENKKDVQNTNTNGRDQYMLLNEENLTDECTFIEEGYNDEYIKEGQFNKCVKNKYATITLIVLILLCIVGFLIDFVYYDYLFPKVNDLSQVNKDNLNEAQLKGSLSELDNPQIDQLLINKKVFELDDIYNSTFRPETSNWEWVEGDNDGLYTYEERATGKIYLKHASMLFNFNTQFEDKVLITRQEIDKHDSKHPFNFYKISADLNYIMVANRYDKVWRHSYTSRYRIFDLKNRSKEPLLISPGRFIKKSKSDNEQKDVEEDFISLFKWSPKGHDISFVYRNDVFVLTHEFKKLRKVSKNGSEDIINGIPDWVYEEEVFASDTAMWWSLDGTYLAYLSFDDSKVNTFQVPLYTNEAIIKHKNLLPTALPKLPNQIEQSQIQNWLNKFDDYPQYLKFKYPKSGHNNPKVTLKLYQSRDDEKFQDNLDILDTFPLFNVEIDIQSYLKTKNIDYKLQNLVPSILKDKDRIISDVVWTTEKGKLLFRFTNRQQDFIVTCIININDLNSITEHDIDNNIKNIKGKVIRLELGGKDFSNNLDGDGGWYQTDSHSIYVIPKNDKFGINEASYIDKIVYNNHYHFALFNLNSDEPIKILTKGNYDVESIEGYDNKNGILYYKSRELHSTASHIFSIKIDIGNKKHISNETSTSLQSMRSLPLTENEKQNKLDLDNLGHFNSRVSPNGIYMILSYLGPHIPYQVLIKSGEIEEAKALINNQKLFKKLSGYLLPQVKFREIKVNGQTLNSKEILPPQFQPKSNKYRLLFRCYGGPESQLVTRNFELNFHTWLTSSHSDIAVITVDGRGTAYKGRKFAVGITGNLGQQEAQDQLGAAKLYSNYSWVHKDRLAIWGWSYGGFLTSKVVEADNQTQFKVAISVAPVTDWRFYDSIYTERYMKLPEYNMQGYNEAAVHDVLNFNNTNYLLLHGVADDNVHYQNSLNLLNLFSQFNITKPKFHSFTDNDHSIAIPHANKHLYTRIIDHLNNYL